MMLSSRTGLALVIAAALVAPPVFAATTSRTTTHHTTASHRLSHSRNRYRRARGQQAIDSDRVTQIQQALIREHYLTGEPNGDWDSTTVAAMQKYQADHGWQIKLMPDGRALKSLGLGPDYSTALNASGANFTPPAAAAEPASQDSGFIAASRVSQ
jgi:peptidoglycan hydrolase-like protein with peptidoglycan-binding domain